MSIPLEAFWFFLCSLGSPFWTVVLSFCSALIVAWANNRALMRVAACKIMETTRQEVLARAVSTAVTEFEGIVTAALQGQSNGKPPPLYTYICFHVVFYFKLNGLTPPTFEEIDDAVQHAVALSKKIDEKYMKTWG